MSLALIGQVQALERRVAALEAALAAKPPTPARLALARSNAPRQASGAKDREAAEWLQNELRVGWVESATIYQRAKNAGIHGRPLVRAARAIGVIKKPTGFRGNWYWALPPEVQSCQTLR
jgi:hypothetical protein